MPIHDADAAVHALYEAEAVDAIAAAFPGSVADGKVDRVALGAQVFGNQAALRRLEAIVHPLVRASETKFLAAAAARGARVVLLDIPLLFETGGETRVDVVVVVSAGAAAQRARVLERPDMNPAKLDAILAKQMPDAEKCRRAHFVVDTAGTLDSTRAQVHGILRAVAAMPGVIR